MSNRFIVDAMSADSTRAYPRYAIEADIEVRAAGGTGRGRTSNISRGGLCVELDRPIEPGLEVDVAVTLVFDDRGHSEPLLLPARVMWSTAIDDHFQVGCQFRGLRPRDAAFLDMFLRYLEGDRPEDGSAPPPADDPFA
jgi:hypothetical protein